MSTPTVVVFSYGGYRLTAHLGDPALVAGMGAHQLSLPFKIAASWLDPKDPAACTPVCVEARLQGDNTGSTRWLGDSAATVLVVRGYPVSEELCFALSNDQVLALDAARQDGALLLRVQLSATLLAPPSGVHFHRLEQVPLRVEEHAWLEQLDRLGSELSILLRVPGAATDPGVDGQSAVGWGDPAVASGRQAQLRLRVARSELRAGRYEACVAACRLVLDSIELLELLPPAKATLDKKAPDRTQAERWAVLRWALGSLASGAHHDGTLTREFNWTRADAEAVLAMTGGLLARGGR